MKKLELHQMEIIYGGRKLASCGQALFWGAWLEVFFSEHLGL